MRYKLSSDELYLHNYIHIHIQLYNYTEYNEEWNVFSAFNPSKCNPPRLCSARGAVMDFLSEPGFEPTTLGYLGFQVQRSIH